MPTYLDDFNRANTTSGLGTIPGGPTWSIISGSWNILSNRANTSTAQSSNPIAVVDTGSPDGSIQVDISNGGGDALYFRVVSSTNWWRLRFRRYTTTNTTYTTEYEWRGIYDMGLTTHTHTFFAWSTNSSSCPYSLPTYWSHSGHQHPIVTCTKTGNTRQVATGTSSTTNYRVYLEKCVNGTVTTVTSSSGSTTRLRADVLSNNISVFNGTSTTPWYSTSDTTHNTATKHGIGRGTSESSGSALDNFKLQTFNEAPFAPSLNAPADGATININNVNRFAWTFSDTDTGDRQTQFTLEYNVIGSSTVGTIVGNTPNNFVDTPSAFFTANNYRWRVKTKDTGGLEGPFSTYRNFTVATAPDTPTITSPANNATIGSTSATVTWSANEQTRYRVRILGDNAGAPDTGNIIFDSNWVTSTATSLPLSFPTNNVTRHIQVAVERSGIPSNYASVKVTVSYSPPSAATLVLQNLPSVGGVRILVTNPSGTPAAISNTIQRRSTNTNWATVAVTGVNGIVIDYQVESKTDYDYRALTLGDNGSTREGLPYAITPEYERWFLKDPDNIQEISEHIELMVDGDTEFVINQHEDQAEWRPMGRPDYQVIRDVLRSDKFILRIQLLGNEQVKAFQEMRRRQKTLLLQSPIQQWYMTFGKDGSRTILNTIDDYEFYTIECIEQRDPFNV